MSRDPYGASNLSSSGGNRSPRSARRVGELPTVDRSPSRSYPAHSSGSRGSPIGRKSARPTRSGNNSPEHGYAGSYGAQQHLGSPYYTREDDLASPIMMDDRGRSVGPGGGHHRSRSASRPAMGSSNPSRYQSLDRAGDTVAHDREFMPIREPRERSLDRSAVRDRSLERGLYLEEELYGGGSRSARQSPNPHMMSSGGRDPGGTYINELQQQNNDLQRELANFKKELELTNQKLGSSMHSIKTFWSPELKKERALRKEESAKYSLINDQLKLLNSENQKQAILVRQLEEELRMRMRNPSVEMQQQMEMLYAENEHLTREIAILRETIKELELRIDTQKQTLQARDESIKKLLEMLQNKGVGGKMLDEERMAFESLQARLIESEDKIRHYENIVRNRDQELSKTKRELKATNETLRALQTQLEKAFRTQNSSGPSNSTLTAILETKDARIATLEKEVALLEMELDRIRECGDTNPIPDHADLMPASSLPKHEFSYKRQLEEFRAEIQRRDQEILAMSAKMKTLEEQHQDYQRHIAVLKESLCAKEEHYNMLQADVEELRQRLDEKNRHIEKKTLTATQVTQDRNRLNNELNELRDHMDIKDRKINVLQRKLDLHEANKKLASGAAKAGEEATGLRMQLEEQKKQLEEQRRKLEEHKKGVDSKSRQLEEKERSIADADQKLKKRKEKLDQMEAQLQRSGGRGGDTGEHQKRLEQELESNRKELQKAQEDAQRSQVEMERLLQLVQMSQEEQNSKEKTIRDLQEALKNAQAKLRSQQSANAQMEEARKREEVEMQDKAVEAKEDTNKVVRELREEVEEKEARVAELEQDVRELEDVLIDHGKVGEVQGLKEEVEKRGQRVEELEQEVSALEAALREHSSLTELEELVGVVRQKDDRIEELEEALRESVRITADREMVLHQEETRRKQIMEKVGKLEQRLLSLQTAHALRCSTCRPLLTRLQDQERRLTQLLAERRDHLQDLTHMKQEALEAAISEKDAHLALLEVSGIRTARQAEEVDQLRADRRRLMDKLKEENERSVRLLQEYSTPESGSLNPNVFVLEGGEEDQNNINTNRHNGHSHQHNEVEQDSLEGVNSEDAASSH